VTESPPSPTRARRASPKHAIAPLRTEPPSTLLTDESAPDFVDVVLELATEVSMAEARLWAEVERLAEAGDLEGVRRLAARRRQCPPVEAAAG
jgi:hypothetical protein